MARNIFLFAAMLFCLLTEEVYAQSNKDTAVLSAEDMAKKRQNPVSGLRSIYLQDIIQPVDGGTANGISLQPVWPFRITKGIKLITYTIIPFQSVPVGDTRQSGLGNILFNGYFSPIERHGNLSWGIGPAVQLPTRTNAVLGSNRVCLGPSGLLYYGTDKFSAGAVMQNFWSLGGEGDNKVNTFNFQYIAYYNLPKAWFLLSNGTMVANWNAPKDDKWLVPLGGGAGKTFKIGSLFYCATGQLMYNAARPSYVGTWQGIIQFQVIL